MKQELDRKILINRVFLFSCTFVATPIVIILAWSTRDFQWYGDGSPLPSGKPDIGLFNILMYFTVWSNILIFAWSSLAMANIYKKSGKLESFIEHWFFKTSITLAILITGIVLNLILVPVSIVTGQWASLSKFILFFFGASLFQHLLVPVFMVRDFFLTKGTVLKKHNSKSELLMKTSISIFVPLFWVILSLIFIGTGILPPQYFFMNVFDTSGWKLAINILILISICISWIIFFYILLSYSNKKYSA